MTTRIPVDVTLRDVPHTEAIEARIRSKAQKLASFYDRIEYCKVVVVVPQKHKHQGKFFRVQIKIGVPGKTLVVKHKWDEDLYVVMRDAFAAMQKQLEHYSDTQHGNVKTHPETLSGQIVRLFIDYGFIESNDGREFYFNQGNVANTTFESLDIGVPVSFIESIADDGLTANHVCTTR